MGAGGIITVVVLVETPEGFAGGTVGIVFPGACHGVVRGVLVLLVAVVEEVAVAMMEFVCVVVPVLFFREERGDSGSGTPRSHLRSSSMM